MTTTSHQSKRQRKLKKMKQRTPVLRFYTVFLGLGLLATAIVGKLLYIQFIDADNLKKKARENRHHSVVMQNRGRILDRNGIVLAQDSALYDLYVHPRYYWGAAPGEMSAALAPILKEDKDKLTKKLAEPIFTILVAKNLTKKVMDTIENTRIQLVQKDKKTGNPIIGPDGFHLTRDIPIPGLDFSKKMVRHYPQGSLAAHLLGYVNDEAGISSGVEHTSSRMLSENETADIEKTMLDGKGQLINIDNIDPQSILSMVDTEDTTLTIDSRIQHIAERELAKGVEHAKAKRGTAIVMDPRNGEILAMAVYPSYEPQRFFKFDAERLKNWAITDVYPPGSTFKILTVASGLDSGVINKGSRINDTGKMKVGGWLIKNYDYYKHPNPGMIDLVYLFLHSSNIGSAKIALKMEQDKFKKYLKGFGLGKQTGIELPGESNGLFIDSKWDQSTHASIGYGYGLAVTPLQMASAIAAIANGGTWNQPRLIKHDKGKNFQYTQRQVISEKTAKVLTGLLRQSIHKPTYSTVRFDDNIHLAGKTGTSRKPREDGKGYENNVFTSFVGYFPAENPKALIMVVVDSPTMAESWGSTVAGPIFKAIAQEIVGYLGIKSATIGKHSPS